MKIDKAAVCIIINDSELISSSIDKVNVFASIFASNSTLEDKSKVIQALFKRDIISKPLEGFKLMPGLQEFGRISPLSI